MLAGQKGIGKAVIATAAMGMGSLLPAKGDTRVPFHNHHGETIMIIFAKEVYQQPSWPDLMLGRTDSLEPVHYQKWRDDTGSCLGTPVEPGQSVCFSLNPEALATMEPGPVRSIPFSVLSNTRSRRKEFRYLAWTSVHSGSDHFATIREADAAGRQGGGAPGRPAPGSRGGRGSAASAYINFPFVFEGFEDPGAAIESKAGAGAGGAVKAPARSLPAAAKAASAGSRQECLGIIEVVDHLRVQGRKAVPPAPIPRLPVPARAAARPAGATPGAPAKAPQAAGSSPMTAPWWNEILDTLEYVPGTRLIRIKPSAPAAGAGAPSRPGAGAKVRPWVPPGAPLKARRPMEPGSAGRPLLGSPTRPAAGKRTGKRGPFTPGLAPLAEGLEFDLDDCLTIPAGSPAAQEGGGPDLEWTGGLG